MGKSTKHIRLILILLVPTIVLTFIAGLLWHMIYIDRRGDSSRKKHAALEKEHAELKTSIMLSQIQPHFLYNALNAIKVLCKQDPEQASYAIEEFANYLRMNMSSLQSKQLVPFTEELQHTKTYLRIEKMRFQDKLNVVYDIRYDAFSIPPLSMQPLVENAVKHGVGQKEEGGTVTIRTKKDGNKIIISIEDDGNGFNPKTIQNDNTLHVGIENVKVRLKSMDVGTLDIKSYSGKGTIASITIKEGN